MVLSVPFGTSSRDALARASSAQMESAALGLQEAQRQAAVQLQVQQAAWAAACGNWQAETQAAAAQEQVAQAFQMGHALGEQPMLAWLQAQSAAHEARLQAQSAAVDVWQKAGQLLLWTREIWPRAGH